MNIVFIKYWTLKVLKVQWNQGFETAQLEMTFLIVQVKDVRYKFHN